MLKLSAECTGNSKQKDWYPCKINALNGELSTFCSFLLQFGPFERVEIFLLYLFLCFICDIKYKGKVLKKNFLLSAF